MKLLKLACVTALLAALSGCATLMYPLPKCDGYSKRPLNRSMWQWEGQQGASGQTGEAGSLTPAHVEGEGTPSKLAAIEGLDIAGSHRACGVA